MTIKNMRNNLLSIVSIALVCLLFLSFSFIFFTKAKKHNWVYVGDSLNSLGGYSFHYSGIARGEYPIWNPLLRSGTNEIIYNILCLANPILNLETVFFVFLNNQDLVFSFSVFIYTMIIAYVVGIFLLVSCWTGNYYAGAFSAILALGSSTVFFYPYHVTFVHMLYAIPWMLYSFTMYSKKLHFKYIVLFLVSCCVFLYSYEFIMGLAYFIILLISYSLFCFRDLVNYFHKLKKITIRHLLIFSCIFLFISLPIFFAFFQYITDLLPISRINNISVTSKYTLIYKNEFAKISYFPLFSKYFITTLFTGFIFSGFNELRQFVGPIAMPFLAVALFSFRRTALCLALSAFLICVLAGNLFPMDLLLNLPIFDSIRNLHFFLQYFIMTIIILAGFGFSLFVSNDCMRLKKVFKCASFLLSLCLAILLLTIILLSIKNVIKYRFITHYFRYDFIIVSASLFVMIVFLYIINSSSTPHRKTYSILTITSLFTIFSFCLISHLPVLSGSLHNNKYLLELRQRKEHLLRFLSERPDNIQTIDLSDHLEEWETDFAQDEYSSLLTLEDNSYKSIKGCVGFSSFPFLKNYYLFLSLPGHDMILKNKFFFFREFFVFHKPEVMLAFKDSPNLIRDMLERGVGVIDKIEPNNINMSLGTFSLETLREVPLDKKENSFSVILKEYKANSIRLKVIASESGLFTYTDLWDKGWRVKIDGKNAPLKKVFHTFKGVIVSRGTHEIEFFYVNSAYYPILTMNVVFVVMLAGLIVYLLAISLRRPSCNFLEK